MRRRNFRIGLIALFILMFCIVWPERAFAEEDVKIVGIYSGQDYLQLYLNDMEGDIKDISCRIASKEVTSEIQHFSVKESDSKTLFLIDPSLSIKEEERKKFGDLISRMIDAKTEKESFAIATYDTGLNYQCDYITDRWEIMKAYEAIEYKKTATDITEVIYNLAKENSENKDSCYKRIIIFSDGYDKAENITKDELYYQLNEVPYSIFTIGCNYESNKEELKSLFALSRVTNAESFQFDGDTDITALQESLQKIDDYIGVRIIPDAALQDGSIKNVELKVTTDTATYVVDKDIKMYMTSAEDTVKQDEQEADEEDLNEDSNKKDNNDEEVNQASSNFSFENIKKYIPFIGGGFAGLVLIGALVFFIIHKKKKNKKNPVEAYRQEAAAYQNFNINFDSQPKKMEEDGNPTVILGSTKGGRMMNEAPAFGSPNKPVLRISLKDLNNGRVFEKNMETEIVIGRVQNMAEGNKIVLDYDTSVSKNHCRIFLQSGNFYIEDLKSSNHTFLNDNIITGICQIRSGDVLGVGRLKLKFTVL
jgi:hypothetical protein